jgi:hypothetical protein
MSNQSSSAKFPTETFVQHHKGGVYKIKFTPEKARLEATGEPAYIYEAADGAIWARSQVEMEDGRFMPYLEPVPTIQQ